MHIRINFLDDILSSLCMLTLTHVIYVAKDSVCWLMSCVIIVSTLTIGVRFENNISSLGCAISEQHLRKVFMDSS